MLALSLPAQALLILGIAAGPARGAPPAPSVAADNKAAAASPQSAQVVLDGRALFRVAGTEALPAGKRALEIAARIESIAADSKVPSDEISVRQEEHASMIFAGEARILAVLDVDARLVGLERQVLAIAIAERTREAIREYRSERTSARLRDSGLQTLLATLLLAVLLYASRLGMRKLSRLIEARRRPAVEVSRSETLGSVASEQFWPMAQRAVKALWWLVALIAVYIYLGRALDNFPWTRRAALWLLDVALDPLQSMGGAIVQSIPDLAYIAILFLIVRYVLQLLALLFLSVAQGTVVWDGFEPEWAMPTFKLIRIGAIAFAIVLAYPYIPGSSSEAFKAVSVFMGVLFSIGSSGLIANSMAGYLILYRNAFRAGDRVTIGEHTGDIVETRQQITVLRTPKNEVVTIPNTVIIGSVIVNYSALARRKQLILHSTVTIGYDAPWRQVEAMLLAAAARTGGLLQEPQPFVLKTALGDFYVSYEINAYCDDASRMPALYSELHQNIIDVFNEYGVQIMSPHFEAQPAEAVVVPREKWHAAPARSPSGV